MEEDQEESNNPDEKIGIGIRIRNKFKTIGEETKAIKGGIMYLLFYCLLFFQSANLMVLFSFYFPFSL